MTRREKPKLPQPTRGPWQAFVHGGRWCIGRRRRRAPWLIVADCGPAVMPEGDSPEAETARFAALQARANAEHFVACIAVVEMVSDRERRTRLGRVR